IPRLPLEEKRLTPIGKAYIDPALCIAWSGRGPCIVCEEMCPLPQKAITLVELPAGPAEQPITIQAPVVNHERCIGCGLCEFKCPVQGEAAIRVRIDPMG
ncbi:MAG: 4Fe-4S dicluster domain-containing protein, partial [Chloroflexi bacterium]|nr:4Fe-4S dicluster domain-containing protein [Chloroflexota bacterium]